MNPDMICNVSCTDFKQRVRKIFLDKEQKHIGITLGEGSYLVQASLDIGSFKCHVLIGKYSSIGHRVKFIIGLNHDGSRVSTYPFKQAFEGIKGDTANDYDSVNHNQIIIGNDVWIGADVTILGGVKIGNGAVIGAGAVVAKDIPPYAVVVGNPAQVVKYRFDKETIDWLQQLRWWNWSPEKIRLCWHEMDDLDSFRIKYESPIQAIENNDKEWRDSIQQLKDRGYMCLYIRPDYKSAEEIWKNVVRKFANANLNYGKNILFIDIPCDIQVKQLVEISTFVSEYKEANVVLWQDENPILDLMDILIITKEAESSYLVDAVSQMNCGIVYGNDEMWL